MWTPLFFLGFIQLIVSREIDPLTQIAQAFFKEDLFYAHLKSEFINTLIDPCDNFYRRLCPRDFPEKAKIWNKTMAQIKAVLAIQQFMSPIEEDYTIERIEAEIAGLDATNYGHKLGILRALKRVSFDTLLALTEVETVFGKRGKKYGNLLRKAFHRNQSAILESFADRIHTFMNRPTVLDSNFTKETKLNKEFEDSLKEELAMLNLVQRKGLDHKAARERIESLISNIIEEYLLAIKNAPWSSKEDRFGYSRKHILTTYFKKLAYAVSFANRYSIPDKEKETFAVKYRNLFVDRYRLLSDMSHMSKLRLFFARSYAQSESLKDESKVYATKLARRKSLSVDAVAYFEGIRVRGLEGGSPAMVIINHFFSIHVSFSAQTASLIAFTGHTFAHELYHQSQFAHELIIEDNSEYFNAKNCIIRHTDSVCSKFAERACSSRFTYTEDAPDVYGAQILFKVLQKMMKGEMDRIVFPDLNMTNRELFYHTLAAGICDPDTSAQWQFWKRPKKNIHNGWMYRANGILGQLPDFKRTFACYDNDRMVVPEKSLCPAFSEYLA